MEKETTVIAGDRSEALRFVEEVRILAEGGTIVTRVGPESKAGSWKSTPADLMFIMVLMMTLRKMGTSIGSLTGLILMILMTLAYVAAIFLGFLVVERIRLTSRWSDAMTSFLVRRGAENVAPGLVGKAPDGTLSQTTTYTVEGKKMVAVLTGSRDGSQTTIKVSLAGPGQQEER